MTVLTRMDTPGDDMVARITDTPTGYAGVDGDEQWAAEVRRLAKLRGATLLAHKEIARIFLRAGGTAKSPEAAVSGDTNARIMKFSKDGKFIGNSNERYRWIIPR